MASITIRPYQDSDKEDFLRGIVELQEYERAIAPLTRRPGKAIDEEYFSYLMNILQKQHGALFVAVQDTQFVGYIACYVERETSISKTSVSNIHGYISDAWVDEPFRTQGIFRQLNQKAEEHLLQFPEIEIIRLFVLADNKAAVSAYEKTGYEPEEILLMKRFPKNNP
jgi:ribosomal protein S18 acetylase RimI-like enzyme